MSPQDKLPFYLYGTGYSTSQLTLGTLIYQNYAVPDNRYVTFPQSELDMTDTKLVTSIPVSGCFTNTSDRKYGFGIKAMHIAEISLGAISSKSKIVYAKSGRRVTLNRPEPFFLEKVIANDDIRTQLRTWLTTSTCEYIFKRATLQKPRIYCVTGFYELEDAVAKTNETSSFNITLDVSDTIMAATTVPIGASIGPFKDGKTTKANVEIKGPAIWAAKFHQLDVKFLKMATKGEPTELPINTMRLLPDVTFAGGVRANEKETTTTEEVAWPEDLKKDGEKIVNTDAVMINVYEAEEVSADGEENKNNDTVEDYWAAFATAEARINEGIETAAAAERAKMQIL